MAKQAIGIGTTPNDGTGDPLRTAFDKTNDNFNELYTSLVIDVVRDYGADPTGGSDSTTAIQNAINAADDDPDGRGGTVFFPYGTYLTSSQITLPPSVHLLGAPVNATGSDYTRIQWDGTTGATMFVSSTYAAGTNHTGSIKRFHFHGNGDADTIFNLNRLDLPLAMIQECLFTDVAGHAIILARGCTNGIFLNCRWDQVESFCIKVEDGSTGSEAAANLNFIACTATIGATGTSGNGQGFLWLDNVAGNSMSNTINLDGVLIEVNADPESFGTQGSRDTGLIVTGFNANTSSNSGYYQTSIFSKGVSINCANDTWDFAYIKLETSDGSAYDFLEADFFGCAANNCGTAFDWIDHTATTFGADVDGCNNIAVGVFSPYHGDPAGVTVRKSYFTSRLECSPGGRNLVIPTDTSSPSYAQKAGMMYFNTGDSKIYVYTGSAWVATAALT